MSLERYQSMRDFNATPEPRGEVAKTNRHRFVVQEHHASSLHFDFRLEMGGVLKSWSIRRGPSLDPAEKRLAVETEDHPVEYLKFEGHIPDGHYGAGQHMIWDAGTYRLTSEGDPLKQLEAGRLKFHLKGRKLRGEFNLVRMGRGRGQWLLIKSRDEFAEEGWQLKLRLEAKDEGGGSEGVRAAKSKSRARSAGEASERKTVVRERKETAKAIAASRAFAAKELSGDADVRVGGHVVSLTNLDKVYWPDDQLTKGDLIRYYYEVSKHILPYLEDRPLIMKRYPNGIRGASFHQHDVDAAPPFVRTVPLATEEDGHTVDYIIGDNLPTLLYMANLGAIERHPWHSRTCSLDSPDWFVFDLDPGEGVSFESICELALVVRDQLQRLTLASYPKTSGSRGIHVYVPLKPVYSYEQVAEFAERVATHIAREHAELATVERSLGKRRRGQIYLDHMQNARGKSVVAPYSVRPKPGATVSAPLEWSEVEEKRLRPQDFTIRNIMRRIQEKGELFAPVLKQGQALERALSEIEEVAPRGRRRASKR